MCTSAERSIGKYLHPICLSVIPLTNLLDLMYARILVFEVFQLSFLFR